MLIVLLGICTFVLITSIYHITILFTWPPSIPSDRDTIKKIVQIICNHYENEPLNIVDVGSGFGHLVWAMQREFSEATVQGYEIFWFPYFVSKGFMGLLSYFRGKKNIKLFYQDIRTADLSNVNVVLCFLLESVNQKISSYLWQGLPNNALVISNNAKFPDWTPIEEHKVKDLFSYRTVYVYRITK